MRLPFITLRDNSICRHENILGGRYNNLRMQAFKEQNDSLYLIFNWPMVRLFTSEELKPSEKTLHIIRQIAYSYRVIKIDGKMRSSYLN